MDNFANKSLLRLKTPVFSVDIFSAILRKKSFYTLRREVFVKIAQREKSQYKNSKNQNFENGWERQ